MRVCIYRAISNYVNTCGSLFIENYLASLAQFIQPVPTRYQLITRLHIKRKPFSNFFFQGGLPDPMYTEAELMFIATFVYLLASRVMLLISININYFSATLYRLFSFEIWKMSIENCSSNMYSKHK